MLSKRHIRCENENKNPLVLFDFQGVNIVKNFMRSLILVLLL
jgi:hypothetical protein